MEINPQTRDVRIKDLNIDPAYQREVSGQRVKRIVNEFTWLLFDAILVSKRADGSLWVIDGGHRVEVGRVLGHEQIAAKVATGLTRKQEAEIWHRKNTGQITPNARARFKGAVAAGDPVALVVQHAMDAAEVHPAPVGQMFNMIRNGMDPARHGKVTGEVLEQALKIYKPAAEHYSKTATVIMGLATLLGDYPGKVNGPRMTEKVLIDKYQDVLVGFAALGEMGSGSRPARAAEVLRKIYNKTRGTKLYIKPDQD